MTVRFLTFLQSCFGSRFISVLQMRPLGLREARELAGCTRPAGVEAEFRSDDKAPAGLTGHLS